MYLNRKSINLIHQLKAIYGDRMAQTNSRFNGCYGVVRIYKKPQDKGHKKLSIYEFSTVLEMENHLKYLKNYSNQ